MDSNQKADYNEEIGIDGRVSKSKMRQMSGIALWGALSYLLVSVVTNWWFWNRVFNLLDKNLISKELFTIMLTSFAAVNVSVFLILIVGAFAPKAVQKFAENKLK